MPPPPDADPEALDALRERIRATQEAVERLAEETARAREQDAPPPSGDGAGEPGRGGPGTSGPAATEELQALVALVELLRGMLPHELQVQVTELIRQFLVVIRALLDWWIERIEVRPAGPAPVEVQDIEVS